MDVFDDMLSQSRTNHAIGLGLILKGNEDVNQIIIQLPNADDNIYIYL